MSRSRGAWAWPLFCLVLAVRVEQQGVSLALVFTVPHDMRAPGAKELTHRTRFLSLDSLYPEAEGKLCDAWDQNAQLRLDIRKAGREDFYEDNPRFDEKRLKALKAISRDLGSSLMGYWDRDRPFPHITQALAHNGFPAVSGELFVSRMAGLCTGDGGEHTFGSWMEIVGRPKGSEHGWHQDSGLLQDTAMLGFPNNNGYEGEGVFSHVIELSHRMPEPETEVPGPVVIDGRFPEEHIIRPVFAKGREIIVYRDCDVLHSAPDKVTRDCLWRFM
mmetsp:Transcript_16808/g.33143  ORF Transcript_16808/g.33143 Transcript_16808/m.33143 type:complete len:274 (-) Transcript_16808:61-882(-)|eukprot:CAMPEP_0173383518 /NCGR_PEP_ID=MMETSP1356-20130122/6103_1 /TAXON_ID=77927 ORGANISM="Hemiselmis virescens, Strain PCC157" /NCGR_SAMPLE_ID=MMETSP1356 /ASSEMBLY_ACC=CAM_ASM_000847 /LENGTH=273 /DNA_ID=CAMNT_0014338449 /DNA_START=57 /DNA_END=878 /DNA_ORIENTATION=+